MRKILFVHQSAEMYGSDKVLLSLVLNIDRGRFTPIVLLPCEGPLLTAFKSAGVRCHVVPLVRAERATLSIKGLLNLPLNTWKSIRAINDVVKSDGVDIVHSNTLAVLSGAIWAWFNGVTPVWHVHEIIESPVFVRKVFAWLLRVFSDKVICNSHATMNHLLQDQPVLQKKLRVVWNGIDREQPFDLGEVQAFRGRLGLSDGEVLVALLGRINRLKGQSLLVDAAERLNDRGVNHVHYVMVGSPPDGQEHFLHTLEARITRSSVSEKVSLLPFTANVWQVWDACDIAVIPSTEPESFGMVALEAMISSKPVIAANHGGLSEIVVHGETGLLFPPNDATELASAIEILAKDRRLQKDMGVKAKELVTKQFSVDAYVAGVSAVYEEVSR